MATYDIDEEYVKTIWSQAKASPRVAGYTLAYVSAAPKLKLAESQIHLMASRVYRYKGIEGAMHDEKFAHLRQPYLFVFVKDDEITEDNKDKHATLKSIALQNPAILSAIQSGGANSNRSRTNKKLEEDIVSGNLTFFIDGDGNMHTLNELPIAMVTRSDDEVSYKTFLNTFKTAKANCVDFADLRRKSIVDSNGNEKIYIYAEVKPELYDKWMHTEASGSFNENMRMLVNNIRLDLDQCANACKEYALVDANFEKGPALTEENRAYISRDFTQSVCLIGSPNYNKGFMAACYANITNKNGNLYPVDDLMFLPDKKTVDQIVEYLDKQNTLQQESPAGLTEEEKQIAEQNVLARGYKNDPKNSVVYAQFLTELVVEKNRMEQQKIVEQNQVTLQFIKKLHPRFKLTEIEFDVEKESLRSVLSYYRSLQELRNRMNYKDPETDRIISMKSAYDLGYSDKERDSLVEAFGEFGGQIYDRAYFIKFANYMLDVYKTTGALYDLTAVTTTFDDPRSDKNQLKTAISKMRDKNIEDADKMAAKIKALHNEASLENFMALVKRFNGAINIHVLEWATRTVTQDGKKIKEQYIRPKVEKVRTYKRASSIYEEVEVPLNFNETIDQLIEENIGDYVTNWYFSANDRDPEMKLFAIPSNENRSQYEEESASFYEAKLKEKLDECEQKVEKKRKQESNSSKTTNKIAGTD